MKEKMKRNFWQNVEVECMLNAIKDLQEVQGNTATTHNTFVQIASRMKRRGFCNKSPTQIRRKWFQMKSAYLCYKRGNRARLLLIPERFRSVIAQFVDNEYKLPYKISTTVQPKESAFPLKLPVKNSSSPIPKQHILPTPAPPIVKSRQSSTPIILKKNEPTKLLTAPTNNIHHKKMDNFLSYLKGDLKSSNVRYAPPETHNIPSTFDPNRIGNVDLADITPSNNVSQKLMCNDFVKMQSDLMAYDHQCQAIRDTQLIAFMTNSDIKF